ncbi:hypothetical protein V2K16_22745 [Pseudomonas alliivorans]|uniref:hypothetical protein n=1 Tax=Pseudomonas alliivorans TaxID=2810613 RepID=UPI001AE86FAF|nr:hypothetical protein [Pseudomonas alliivorans]MBP0943099.1 hypothetical protein [Pseudomonas alliivorans]MEE4881195.1 hypothetical protein [Pseudomonas alliivorans]MEE4932499.1 hypothetical protein [Pseudomonas alliivorans]MEE4937962.1 hypothetical protein [Pseudomonas alliivorans]MEE4943105.1 hypothetical protein [Pseudomonas alliivorans]
MLGEIPFEDQFEITEWFFDSLDLNSDTLPEDRLFVREMKFGWIKLYCERARNLGISTPPIVEVIRLIEQDEHVCNLFVHLATLANAQKDVMAAARLREEALLKGDRLIIHIRDNQDFPESLEVFCLIEY